MSNQGHYVGPVILASDEEARKKERLIEIYKNNVYKDIELYTYKHMEGTTIQDTKVGNAISADNSEDMDGAIIARYVEFRDAQLRRKLRFALAEVTRESADDEITLESNVYRYFLIVPDSFNDNALRPLAEYFHRFLVFGALYDWYEQFGMSKQAAYYGAQLDTLEDLIVSTLKGPSIVKRPLQPFGPAQKIY